jgi:hypothetical protein
LLWENGREKHKLRSSLSIHNKEILRMLVLNDQNEGAIPLGKLLFWREVFLAGKVLAGFSWFSFWICFCFPNLESYTNSTTKRGSAH